MCSGALPQVLQTGLLDQGTRSRGRMSPVAQGPLPCTRPNTKGMPLRLPLAKVCYCGATAKAYGQCMLFALRPIPDMSGGARFVQKAIDRPSGRIGASRRCRARPDRSEHVARIPVAASRHARSQPLTGRRADYRWQRYRANAGLRGRRPRAVDPRHTASLP
jgi:hypothetical protein